MRILSTFNATETRQQLALMYSVPPEYIVLNATAGSVVVDVTIVLPASAAATRPLAQVQQQVASTNSSTLAISLGRLHRTWHRRASAIVPSKSTVSIPALSRSCAFPVTGAKEVASCLVSEGSTIYFRISTARRRIECQAYSTTNAIGTIEPRDCICKRTFLRIDPPSASMNDTRAECK